MLSANAEFKKIIETIPCFGFALNDKKAKEFLAEQNINLSGSCVIVFDAVGGLKGCIDCMSVECNEQAETNMAALICKKLPEIAKREENPWDTFQKTKPETFTAENLHSLCQTLKEEGCLQKTAQTLREIWNNKSLKADVREAAGAWACFTFPAFENSIERMEASKKEWFCFLDEFPQSPKAAAVIENLGACVGLNINAEKQMKRMIETLNNMAKAKTGKDRKAMEDHAVSFEKNCRETFEMSSEIYGMMKAFAEDAGDSDPMTHLMLAEQAAILGKLEEAKASFEKAGKSWRDDPEFKHYLTVEKILQAELEDVKKSK